VSSVLRIHIVLDSLLPVTQERTRVLNVPATSFVMVVGVTLQLKCVSSVPLIWTVLPLLLLVMPSPVPALVVSLILTVRVLSSPLVISVFNNVLVVPPTIIVVALPPPLLAMSQQRLALSVPSLLIVVQVAVVMSLLTSAFSVCQMWIVVLPLLPSVTLVITTFVLDVCMMVTVLPQLLFVLEVPALSVPQAQIAGLEMLQHPFA